MIESNLPPEFWAAMETAKTQEEIDAAVKLLPKGPPPSLDSPDPYERYEAQLREKSAEYLRQLNQ